MTTNTVGVHSGIFIAGEFVDVEDGGTIFELQANSRDRAFAQM